MGKHSFGGAYFLYPKHYIYIIRENIGTMYRQIICKGAQRIKTIKNAPKASKNSPHPMKARDQIRMIKSLQIRFYKGISIIQISYYDISNNKPQEVLS